jgi:hypothetical protein
MRFRFRVFVLSCFRGGSLLFAQEPARISDNSFLIEEAYNQEPGVVQHISTLVLTEGGDWAYGFTQEWPFFGQRHQLSYTIPLARIEGLAEAPIKLGDVALNYRLQLTSRPNGFAISPRVSLLLPTGDETTGHGSGQAGVQLNLPVSIPIGSRVVTHFNAGVTYLHKEDYSLGASAILLLSPTFNLMLEGVWSDSEGEFLNPGMRYAINTKGGLQIVPGVAYTIGLGPHRGENRVFLYLSFEHAFRRTAGS